MKNYLKNLFTEYSYEKSDAEFLLGSYDKISQYKEFSSGVSLYSESYNCDYEKVFELVYEASEKAGVHRYTACFLALAVMAKKLKDYYAIKGYSDTLYKNSVFDLKYKLDECKCVKGIIGVFTDWFKYFLMLKIFTFNRLQFEITNKDVVCKDNKELPNGELISIHIPRTLTPLTPESVDKSLEEAKQFFKPLFKEKEIPFVCGSYLLHKSLRTLYKDGTNLKAFSDKFKIVYEADYDNYLELWRFFDVEFTSAQLLPEKSSLQKALKQYVINGNPIGYALGYFYY